MTNVVLPAILLLKNRQTCLLIKIQENGVAQIIEPETTSDTAAGVKDIPLNELNESYTNYAVFAQPTYQFNERSAAATTQPVERHWFWDVIHKAWPVYGEVLVASLMINLFALTSPLFIRNIYDRVVPNQAEVTLWVLAIGMLIIFSFDFLMRIIRGYFIDVASKNIDVKLSSSIYEQLMGMPMSARPASVGVMANMVHAFESFRDFITSATISVVIDLPFIFLFLLVIGIIGGSLVIIPAISIPIVLAIAFFIQKPLNNLIQQTHRHSAEKHATLVESLVGVETIKTSNAEGHMQYKWERVIGVAAKIGVKIRLLSSLGINLSMFIQQLANIAVIIFGVYKIVAGDITMGTLIACTILTGRALAPLTALASLIIRYQESIESLQALDKIMQLPPERAIGKSLLHRPALQGSVEFQAVSFNYPEQPVSALTDVSFKIQPGEKVGIIGRIGSGKSTIERLILGLYHPTAGSILLDGAALNQIDPSELRHQIGYVGQDALLFYGNIKYNITLGAPYISDDAILRAAQISGVDDFVKLHPEGYDRQVGERGEKLSGGQRQAIAIARAILLDPAIVLLDEPSSAMDDRSENHFKNLIVPHLAKKTLILVTHKGSMLSLVDRLIVMDNGHLVADGPKESVIKSLAEGKIRV
jgi:ATP-binding cassette subfamily C protein LapB